MFFFNDVIPQICSIFQIVFGDNLNRATQNQIYKYTNPFKLDRVFYLKFTYLYL